MINDATDISQPPVPSANNTAAGKSGKWFRSIGPGVITAALVFGPSKITITSVMGARYGYSLIWLIAVTIFFMIIFTTMAARVGIATQQSLLTTIGMKWGKAVKIAMGIGVFLVCASFQAGNSIGIGMAVAEGTKTPTTGWIILFNAIAIGLLFFKTFYKTLERVMIGLIALMLIAFLTTLFLAGPDVPAAVQGLKPVIPEGSLKLVIAFTASCFSIVGAIYQTYLVQERRRWQPGIQQTGRESITGMIILGILSAVVLICSAAVLHTKGITVNSATDMARALEPIFGNMAASLFLAGLFGASFSTLIGNASLGGTLLGDALGYGSQLNSGKVRTIIGVIMFIGASVAITFGKLPLELIILAQTVTIFIVPFIGIALFLVANDKQIMGSLKNNVFANIAGGIGLLVMLLLAAANFKTLFL
jgi:manganese transport protein